tara:strand:- start:25 stop:408 length:384 start_codon:yes stop_codon:yes gene_type:complete
MKILGIGVDLILNKRLKILINNKNFINRTFSKKEINFSKKKNNRLNYFAKRFAAKESFSKSLGTGIGEKLKFKDIEILNDKKGKPFYFKNKTINTLIYKRFKVKRYNLFLSISDEKDYSIAFTIIQK